MLSQLNMTTEARNLLRFRQLFAEQPEVVFPRPYLPLTSQNVLVESLEEGLPMRLYTKTRGIWSEALGGIGISAFLAMTLSHNFVVRDGGACGGAAARAGSADQRERKGVRGRRPPVFLSTLTCIRATCSCASAASSVRIARRRRLAVIPRPRAAP